MNAREKEKKKTAIRAAAKKGSFQDNEKNGGERGNLSPPKNVLLVRLKEDFRWFEKRIRDKNCGEIKTSGRSREASSCFFFSNNCYNNIVCHRGEIIRITYLIIDIIRLTKVFWHSVVVRLRQEPFYGGTLFGLQQ